MLVFDGESVSCMSRQSAKDRAYYQPQNKVQINIDPEDAIFQLKLVFQAPVNGRVVMYILGDSISRLPQVSPLKNIHQGAAVGVTSGYIASQL